MNSVSLGHLQLKIGYLTTMQERSEFMMSFKGHGSFRNQLSLDSSAEFQQNDGLKSHP
jgi:hypothetical protein